MLEPADVVVLEDAEGGGAAHASGIGATRSGHRDEQGDYRADGDERAKPPTPQPR